MNLFKKREAFAIADDTKIKNKNKKNDFKTSKFKFVDAYGTNIDDKDVMQKWVERRLIVRAENQIITREYMRGQFWSDFWKICIAALLVTIGFDYFVSASGSNGLFPFGVGAFARFLAILSFPGNDQISQQATFYFVYFFALNIPLMIFGMIKVGAKFTLLTLVYLVLQIAFDQILQVIPVISPNEWQIVVSTQEIGAIPTSWNGPIWLFIKALIGAVILGVGYSIGYKAGSSSAGIDFVTMYISLRKERSIATVNRYLNYAILFTIVVLNTVILKAENFNPDIKYGQLYMSHDVTVWNDMMTYISNNSWKFSDDVVSSATKLNLDQAGLDNLISGLNTKEPTQLNMYQYQELITEVVKSDFNGFSRKMISLMRFEFIFGPSLFASLILVIGSSLVTDILYPTHKIKTYLIATQHADAMKKALTQIGYRNNFIEWEANNELQGKILDRNIVMVTMTATNWREVEPVLESIDDNLTVNILKTDQVKGYFDYQIRSDRKNEAANKILIKDKEWVKEIHEASLIRTDKEYTKYITKKENACAKFDYDVPEVLDDKKSIDIWYKKEMAIARKSKERAIIELDHKWLLKWAQSQKQYDYIKREYIATLKSLKVNRKEVHYIKKEHEIKLKELKLKSK